MSTAPLEDVSTVEKLDTCPEIARVQCQCHLTSDNIKWAFHMLASSFCREGFTYRTGEVNNCHSVEVEIDDYEHVSGLDEVTETIDEIPVTSMHLASPGVRSNSRDVHQSRQTRIDDFVAEWAMYVLEQMRPYPNDGPLFEAEDRHFMVYQFEPDLYVIMD